MPKQKINDTELYYEIHGEGYPVVMIMGLGANIYWWTPEFLEPMKNNFQTIIFDNRDAGRSDHANEQYQIADLATDTIKLMDMLNIDKAHILGISMGGMIAQEVTLNYPERVNKLVLCSTNCGGAKSILPSQDLLAQLTQDRGELSQKEIIEKTIPLLYTNEFIDKNPEYIERTKEQLMKAPIQPEAYERQIQSLLSFNTGRKLKKIEHQTLVIHGKKDILVPPQNGQILTDLITNATLKYFEKSAHAIFSHEPEKVTTTVLDFLKE
ncbi:MAG: alpha/beta fold hydrolase [Promethearchaeati archaeon]